MEHIIAQLNDADISLTLLQGEGGYRIVAERSDSIHPPEVVLNQEHANLGSAIKAITIFYVQEWESIFLRNRLSEKLEQALQAS